MRPYLQKTQKKAGRVAQAIEGLPSKCEGPELKPHKKETKKETLKKNHKARIQVAIVIIKCMLPKVTHAILSFNWSAVGLSHCHI
jgi:hypothetical protein